MTSRKTSAWLGAAIIGITMCAAGEASATIFCELKKTPDGFIALRAGPSADARLIGRMAPGDHLQVHSEEKGQWTRATWWKRSVYKDGVLVGRHKPHGRGWMNATFIVPDSCG